MGLPHLPNGTQMIGVEFSFFFLENRISNKSELNYFIILTDGGRSDEYILMYVTDVSSIDAGWVCSNYYV